MSLIDIDIHLKGTSAVRQYQFRRCDTSMQTNGCDLLNPMVRLDVPLRQDKKNTREVYGWQKQKIRL